MERLARHGRRRGRSVVDVLRGQRVPLPVPDQGGWKEATRAFNTALARLRVGRPEAADRLVPDPDPRHRRRRRRGAVGGDRAAASRCSCRCSRPSSACPTTATSATTRSGAAIQETGLPICCHIGLNTELDDLARRDPTPQKGIFVPMVALSTGEAFGMWIMAGVSRALPGAQGRVRRARARLGGVVPLHRRRHGDAPGLRVPGVTELPSFYFHRNIALTFIDEPDAIRQPATPLGIENIMWSTRLPAPGVELAALPASWWSGPFAGVPDDERDADRVRQRRPGLEPLTALAKERLSRALRHPDQERHGGRRHPDAAPPRRRRHHRRAHRRGSASSTRRRRPGASTPTA